MKSKHALPFIIFVATTLGFSFIGSHMMWLVLIPGLYGIAQLLHSIYFLLLKKDKKSAFHLFFTGILYLLVPDNVLYYFYNFVFSILVLLIIYHFYYQKGEHKNTKLLKNNMTILLLMFFNIILIFIPESLIFKFQENLENKRASWSEDIGWEVFQGERKDSSKYSAEIEVEIDWTINRAYNYPQADMISAVVFKKSWKDTISFTPYQDSMLLRHEQYHFNIAELYKRKAKDSINKVWLKDKEEIESIIYHFVDLNKEQQILYDSLTNHSQHQEEQKKWETKISAELGIEP